MKKKHIYLFFFLLSINSFSQVAIGKSSVTNNTSVSLEFGNISGDASTQRGILLPWVTSSSATTNAVSGTLIFDTSDKKAKCLMGNTWIPLTDSGTVDTSLQDNLTELTNAKVSIGTPSSTPGILVLEASNKAMILPIVDSYKSIVNPSPGMMVYDNSNEKLCFFNGSIWTFWTF